MPDNDTAQDPPQQPQSAPLISGLEPQQLISNPELQYLLETVANKMGLPPEYALRRSLETILALYQAAAQGGQPIIRYPKTRTEQSIILPGAS